MNFIRMPQPTDKRTRQAVSDGRRGGDAFDLWLQRGLHDLFDDVAKEPVPDELLTLIEAPRGQSTPSPAAPSPLARLVA